MYTTSAALLDAMTEAGISHVFANFGSDHPAFVEAVARAEAQGRTIPKILTCPNEMVALSCAQGYAQVCGRPQAVVVHVECGTQALAGAVHNAARGRVPVLIYAGLSPFTQDGELRGSRNEFIQWIQDVHDQRGIVREYMKYTNEIRTGRNVGHLVHRALQIACTDPKGPVYLVGAREVMEAETEKWSFDPQRWNPVRPASLPEGAAQQIVDELVRAERPLLITSYLGRNARAVAELVRFCHALGIGVLESVPNYMNYPHDDELYVGNRWNHPWQSPALAEADVILVIDSDVPWIPTVSRPSRSARILHIDVDPLKESMPLWYIEAHASFCADSETALRQLNACAAALGSEPPGARARRAHYAEAHRRHLGRLAAEAQPRGAAITAEYLTACIRRAAGAEAIYLSEGITNYPAICNHVAPNLPGSYFNSGGGSLGWNGGAAIGMKLACPQKDVVALCGDGSYLFSVPSTVHWMARRYEAPFLQVVYNNGGWAGPKFSTLAVHPDGYASRARDLHVSFDPSPEHALIAAAAGGAHARKISRPEEVEHAVAEALRVVREERRAAVLDVVLPPL